VITRVVPVELATLRDSIRYSTNTSEDCRRQTREEGPDQGHDLRRTHVADRLLQLTRLHALPL
jgi:hypothetical protein